MVDFSNLKGLELKDRTAQCVLSFQTKAAGPGEEVPYPVLTVKSATEANKPFANEQFRMTKRTAPIIRAGAINLEVIAETRNNDRKLYAKHVIVGWTGIYDSHGEEVPFSPEECEVFLEAIPDWAFDQIRNFCTSPENFVEQINYEAIAKN